MKSVDDLLTDWEDGHERGEHPSAEQLFAEYPEHLAEVRRQIQALQSFASRFGIRSDDELREDEDGSEELSRLPEVAIRITTEYQLERLHAVGGLGSVYLARDTGLSRKVALKFPRGKRHSPQIRQRFEREARITSRLDHPGIVPVHAIHTDPQGQPCYAMRFIEGSTLQAAIDSIHCRPANSTSKASLFHSVVFRDLLRRFQYVCDIAAYAHSQGVIHRDIKPSNVMLGSYGETLLVDWGLAKVGQELDAVSASPTSTSPPDPVATRPGEAIGTPAFASPEQLSGNLAQVTSLSDVYSLGATLLYLLTGKHSLSNADLPQHLTRVEQCQLLGPTDFLNTVPAPLDAICRKAMAVTPADRYASPQELARDLERFLSDEPIGISRDGWRVCTGRWLRKHPVSVAAALATVGVGLVAAITSSLVLNDKNAKLDQTNEDLKYSYVELAKAWAAKSNLQMKIDASQPTTTQLLKSLTSLSDQYTSTFPDRTQLVTAGDRPFLEKLLERYRRFSAYNGGNQEGRFVRAMGAWQSGGLLLTLGRYSEAETQLVAARQDLLVLQSLSLVPAMDQCTAQCCLLLAECQKLSGQSDLATETYREALTRFNKLLDQGAAAGLLRTEIDMHRAEALCSLGELSASEQVMHELEMVSQKWETELGSSAEPLRQKLTQIRILRLQAQAARLTSQSPRQLLERALRYSEILLKAHPAQRRVRWELAGICCDLGRSKEQESNILPPTSLDAVSRSIWLYHSLNGDCPGEGAILAALASALDQRSQMHQIAGNTELEVQDASLATKIRSSATTPIDLASNDETGSKPLMALGDIPDPPQSPANSHAETVRSRQLLIDSLSAQRDRYIRSGNLEHALVTWEREQRLRRDARFSFDQESPYAELEQGLTPYQWIQEDGEITFVETVGYASGFAWGSGPYTDDSDLCTTAIHSGHLKPNESRYLALRRHTGPAVYKGSHSHGVLTADCDLPSGGYHIVASAARLRDYNHLLVYQPEIRSVNVLVTGEHTGVVTGTDRYAIDSDLPTAAVHQGLLKPGELGVIHVEFLPGIEDYVPSTRNGITSGTLNSMPGSMRLTRVDLSKPPSVIPE